jgi:osmotically-inducible protein OsmY
MTFQDLSLTAKVKSALARADDVSAMDIDVDVKNGVVSLSGNVSRKGHDRAIEVTSGIDGVTSLEDHLTISSES